MWCLVRLLSDVMVEGILQSVNLSAHVSAILAKLCPSSYVPSQ